MFRKLAIDIKKENGQLLFVGGCVRDSFLDITPKDFDLLIVGLDINKGLEILNSHSKLPVIKVIGNAPVFMYNRHEVAFARKEVSTGDGKSEFEFITNKNITLKEDLIRRDFTINSLAQDVLTLEIFDFFGGIDDINNKTLRHISQHFSESPERVFRLCSFAARFDFKVARETIDICKSMIDDFITIPKEQLWRFFEKGLSLTVKPSRFIEVLELTSWIIHFPEIHNMLDLVQSPTFHPEGCVLTHTKHVIDEIEPNLTMRLVALCHDMGKPNTTFIEDGLVKSPGHAQETEVFLSFLDSICCPIKLRDKIVKLCLHHMDHIGVTVNKRFVRRLARRLDFVTIIELSKIVLADHSGRPPLAKVMPSNMIKILEIAKEIGTEVKFTRIMLGRHLIEVGMKPSKSFGIILQKCEDAQIKGLIVDVETGKEFVRKL